MTGSKNRTLLKVSDVKKLTGWDYRELERARALGWIEMIRKDKKIFYIRESLKEHFIKAS